MRIHRFITPFDPEERFLSVRDEGIVGQVRKVLRLGQGDFIDLSDGELHEAHCRIRRVAAVALEVEIMSVEANTREPASSAELYCALLKRENFELAAQKATEVGVRAVTPVITGRTVKFKLDLGRLGRIVREAAEQSGRGIVPLVHPPRPFGETLPEAGRHTLNFFFSASGEPFANIRYSSKKGDRVGLFIGPEGGWTGDEEAEARRAKMRLASLGPLTLRAETAAVIASYLVVRGYQQLPH